MGESLHRERFWDTVLRMRPGRAGSVAALGGVALAAFGMLVLPARSEMSAEAATVAAEPAATVLPPARPPENLTRVLGDALASHTRGGEWGVLVVSLTRGDTLFSRNPDQMLLPASTMKLYTAAMALERFGSDHVFRTTVYRDGRIGSGGVLDGNLYLQGVGDPSLTRRFWRDRSPMDALAEQVVAAGIRHVRGGIIGDATAFEERLVPEGWDRRFLGAGYAAPFSALSLQENVLWVVVEPHEGRAHVRLDPATTSERVENQVSLVAGRGGRINASRRADGVIVVRGSIGTAARPLRYSIVAQNPPLFTTGALRAALESAGVTVDAPASLGRTPPDAEYVAALGSPPLAQIVGEMNRESINVFAELLYRSSATEPGNGAPASAEGALATLRDLMSERAGAEPEWVEATDGSGLSSLDRVSARSLVHLLDYAHTAPWAPAFHASLPVKGQSGTLRTRRSTPETRGNLHAKTGTTNRAATLAGYVTARNGEVLGFAFLYNGNDRSNARAAMDQMGAAMAELLR